MMKMMRRKLIVGFRDLVEWARCVALNNATGPFPVLFYLPSAPRIMHNRCELQKVI
jgi:hypothetical protein